MILFDQATIHNVLKGQMPSRHLPHPSLQPGEVLVAYGGWNFNVLMNCPNIASKVHVDFSLDDIPCNTSEWFGHVGLHRVQLANISTDNKMYQQQYAAVEASGSFGPACMCLCLFSLFMLETLGHTTMRGRTIRCKEVLPRQKHLCLICNSDGTFTLSRIHDGEQHKGLTLARSVLCY